MYVIQDLLLIKLIIKTNKNKFKKYRRVFPLNMSQIYPNTTISTYP